ncbi:hypothetical protein G6F57_018873 [Rhizopus arrhizus]|nr:hypothetical protein G6F57_018873 [Rhizopus arrhizus]
MSGVRDSAPGRARQRKADPQQLIAATQHTREIACRPGVQRLQQVEPERHKGSDRVDHAAQDQSDQRHDEGRAQRHPAQQRQEQQGAGQRESRGGQHLADHRRIRRQQGNDQDAQRRGLDGAGRRRFHETVAHQHLHDQASNRQRHAGQQQGHGAWHAADHQEAPGAVGLFAYAP